MNRRDFMLIAGVAGLSRAQAIRGEHRLTSLDPVLIDTELTSQTQRYTPVADFYVRNHASTPVSVPAILRIEGEVEQPVIVSPDCLEGLATVEVGSVLECAGNLVSTIGKVSNGLWKGWRIANILKLVRIRSANHLHLFGRDGYSRSVPVERAVADGLFVTHLNSRPLTPNHGAPWRAVLPGWYGMDSVKWVERLVVAKDPLPPRDDTYLEVCQSSSGAITKNPLPRTRVKSIITVPHDGSIVRRGRIRVSGFAWCGAGVVTSVQLSADQGKTWKPAELDAPSRYEWVRWSSAVELTPTGAFELVCSATDETGATQPSQRENNRLDGYANNWYHRIRLTVI